MLQSAMARLFMLLLPALVPSWRFFDRIGPSPRLEVNLPGRGWCPFQSRPAHLALPVMLARLFYNPHWNAALFRVSLMERLLGTGAPEDAERLHALVAQDAPDGSQLRIALVTRTGKEIAYQAALHEL